MHTLKIDIINAEDNSGVKSGVTMETDGKLSISEMNEILIAQGGNLMQVVEVVKQDPLLPWNLFKKKSLQLTRNLLLYYYGY